MEPQKVHLSWADVDDMVDDIVGMIRLRHLNIERVVGISRGGLIPAVIASHKLNVPMVSVSYSAKEGRGDNKNHDNHLPTISDGIDSGTGHRPSTPMLLIIDDISDSGITLEQVTMAYYTQGHDIRTATLTTKQQSAFKPNFTGQMITDDSLWVVFPWEE